MGKTNIEYADEVSNPLQVVDKLTGKKGTHCEKPDPEGTCKHCWAEVLNTNGRPENMRFGTGLSYDKSNRDRIEWFRHEKEMARLARLNERKPSSRKFSGNPLIVFTNDTYDLFQPSISDDLRDWVFDSYDAFTSLTLLVQTTYVSRMNKYLVNRYPKEMPSQYVIGMSAGNQEFFVQNFEHLLDIQAYRRYVIFEPLLGPVSLRHSLERSWLDYWWWKVLRQYLHLVIVGGESGPNARPCDVEWIRSLVDEVKAADVAVLVKQLGSKSYDSREKWYTPGSIIVPVDSEWHALKIKDRKGGDQAEMPEDLRIREFPKLEVPA